MSKNKFTKVFLTNVLGLNSDEVSTIMKYQRLFPSLLKEDEGFCIDGETLCKELKVKDSFTTWLLGNTRLDSKGNIKSQGKLTKYRFVENTDYISDWDSPNAKFTKKEIEDMSPQKRSAYRISKVVILTLDCAKKIAMRQNNEQGDLVCDYFILMEKALKKLQEHEEIRHPEKQGYKEMCKQLDIHYQEKYNTITPRYEYIKNANMINIALLGKTAQEIKDCLDIADNQTRENLSIETNKAIYELQILNIGLIISDMEYEQRQNIIEQTCKVKYNELINNIHNEFSIL